MNVRVGDIIKLENNQFVAVSAVPKRVPAAPRGAAIARLSGSSIASSRWERA